MRLALLISMYQMATKQSKQERKQKQKQNKKQTADIDGTSSLVCLHSLLIAGNSKGFLFITAYE